MACVAQNFLRIKHIRLPAPVPGDSAAAYLASTERVFWNALVT